MTNASPQSPPSPASPTLFETLVPYKEQVGYVLIGAGVALSAIPIVNGILYRFDNPPLMIWGTFVSLLVLISGVLYKVLPHTSKQFGEADLLRMLALLLGGVGGFATALFGLALPLVQYHEELSGGLQAWREHRGPLTWSALAFLGGLALMFLGLMQARTYERTRPELRRLLYGYNAVLSGLLLLCILFLVNILPYSPVWPLSLLGKPLDMTSTGDFTLKPATISMLQALTKPVKIYVLLTSQGGLDEQSAVLLNQARSANGLITWETVSRDLNPDKWKELEQDYKIPGGGMLVVYGAPPEVSTEHIKWSDLMTRSMRPGEPDNYNGEYALMSAITSLYEGKSRPVIYFTQGNGELEMQQAFAAGGERSLSMGLFIEDLSKGNYKLQPLPFDRKALSQSKSVPEDAEVLVIAGPRQPLSPEAIDALRKYVRTPRGADKKKGKLIVLLDVVVDEQKKAMVQTNLEPLLREYNVEVGNSRVVAIRPDEGLSRTVITIANSRNKSPIGAAFYSGRTFMPFFFINPRPVEPAKTPPGGAGAGAEADVLLMSYDNPDQKTWTETDLVMPLNELLKKYQNGPEPDFRRIPLAVTVTEPKEAAAELPMGHPPAGEQTPRMVVFGDARWLADDNEPKLRQYNIALISSCLSWLRERPDIGPPPAPKEHPTYTLTLTDVSSGRRLLYLPGALLLLGIATLGGGVWVVRRR